MDVCKENLKTYNGGSETLGHCTFASRYHVIDTDRQPRMTSVPPPSLYRFPPPILYPTQTTLTDTMKPTSLVAYPAATIFLILAASASPRPLSAILKSFQFPSLQSPISLPNPFANMPSDESVSTGVIISDVIGKTQSIAIFSGLTRDIDPVSDRLDDGSKNATVLAPDNGVMRGLKRKPWEDPEDYNTFGEAAYHGQDGEDRAHKNLRRFVESHIITESPWDEGKKVNTLAGNEVWWEMKDGKKKVRSVFGAYQNAILTVVVDPAR